MESNIYAYRCTVVGLRKVGTVDVPAVKKDQTVSVTLPDVTIDPANLPSTTGPMYAMPGTVESSDRSWDIGLTAVERPKNSKTILSRTTRGFAVTTLNGYDPGTTVLEAKTESLYNTEIPFDMYESENFDDWSGPLEATIDKDTIPADDINKPGDTDKPVIPGGDTGKPVIPGGTASTDPVITTLPTADNADAQGPGASTGTFAQDPSASGDDDFAVTDAQVTGAALACITLLVTGAILAAGSMRRRMAARRSI